MTSTHYSLITLTTCCHCLLNHVNSSSHWTKRHRTSANSRSVGSNVGDLKARVRLAKRKEELEELLQELEQRLDDGEAQIAASAAEKKKLLTSVQDLEEQYVFIVISIAFYSFHTIKVTRLEQRLGQVYC